MQLQEAQKPGGMALRTVLLHQLGGIPPLPLLQCLGAWMCAIAARQRSAVAKLDGMGRVQRHHCPTQSGQTASWSQTEQCSRCQRPRHSATASAALDPVTGPSGFWQCFYPTTSDDGGLCPSSPLHSRSSACAAPQCRAAPVIVRPSRAPSRSPQQRSSRTTRMRRHHRSRTPPRHPRPSQGAQRRRTTGHSHQGPGYHVHLHLQE